MADTLGEAIITIRLDTGDMDRGVSQAEQKLRSLGREADNSERSLLGLIKAGAGLALGFGAVNSAVAGLQSFAKATVGAGIGLASLKENARLTFTTLTGSVEEADRKLKELQKFAATTPFEFPELLGASQRLTALGVSADKIVPTLRAIGDAAAGSGAPVDLLVRALGQMVMKGKVSAEEMLQLSEQQINAWQYLADYLGVTVPEAMKMAQKGMIDGATGANAILLGMQEQFGGLMDAQSRGWTGLISTLKDLWRGFAAEFMEPVFEKLKAGLQLLVDILSAKKAEEAVAAMADAFEAGFNRMVDALKWLGAAALEYLPDIIARFFELAGAVADVLATVIDAIFEAGDFLADAFGAMVDGVSWAIDGIIGLAEAIADPFLDAFGAIAGGLSGLVEVFAEALSAIAQVIASAIGGIIDLLSYLNPFARHSPSLVDQVQEGTAVISDSYQSMMDRVAATLGEAEGAVGAFAESMGGLADAASKATDPDILEGLAKIGNADMYTSAAVAVANLKDTYADLATEIENTKEKIKDLEGELKAAEQAYNGFKNATLAEEVPYNNQIDSIDTQIKQKKLAINKLKQQGPLDEEVTVYDEKGKAKKEKRRTALGKQVDALQAEIDALSLQREGLDLERDLKIDPLKKQIEDLADTIEGKQGPLSFSAIIEGMKTWGQKMTELHTAIDAEKTKLGELEKAYKDVGAAIKVYEGAIKDLTDALPKESGGGGGKAGTDIASLVKQRFGDALAPEEDVEPTTDILAQRIAKSRGFHPDDSGNWADAKGNTPDWGKIYKQANQQLDPLGPYGDQLRKAQEGVDKIKDSFSEMSESMKNLGESMKPVGQFFGFIIAAKDALITAWTLLAGAVMGYNAALIIAAAVGMTAMGPFTILAAICVALGVAIVLLIKYWDDITEKVPFLGSAVSAVWGVIEPVIGFIVGAIGALAGWFVSNFDEIVEHSRIFVLGLGLIFLPLIALVTLIIGHWDTLKSAFFTIFEAIKGFAVAFAEVVIEEFRQWGKIALWVFDNVLKPAALGFWDMFGGPISWAMDKLFGVWSTQWGAIEGFFKRVWEGMQKFWDEVVGPFWDKIDGPIMGAVSKVETALKAFFSPFSWVLDDIIWWANQFGKAINWITTHLGFGPVFDGLVASAPGGDGWGNYVGPRDATRDNAHGLIEGLAAGTNNWKGGWAVVGENGPELVKLPGQSVVLPNQKSIALLRSWGVPGFGLGGTVKDVAGDAWDSMTDKAKGALGAIGADKVADLVSGLGSSIKDIVAMGPWGVVDATLRKFGVDHRAFKIGSMPDLFPGVFGKARDAAGNYMSRIWPFANGGVITRPTLGLLGEAGPEAVVPLKEFRNRWKPWGPDRAQQADQFRSLIMQWQDHVRQRMGGVIPYGDDNRATPVNFNAPVTINARDRADAERGTRDIVWALRARGGTF